MEIRAPEAVKEHSVEIPHAPGEVLAAAAHAADLWGAGWERAIDGGRLELPVTAGVRHGVLTGRIKVEAAGAGSRVTFSVDQSRYRLNLPAVVVLAFGALGGIGTTLWPFYPKLLAVAPLAVVLALAAWFLVVARLRSSGPEEFLELVAEMPEDPSASEFADPVRE